MCIQQPGMKYELRVFRSDKVYNKTFSEFDMEYVMGICTFESCDQDALTAFDTFYIQSAMETLNNLFSKGAFVPSLDRL